MLARSVLGHRVAVVVLVQVTAGTAQTEVLLVGTAVAVARLVAVGQVSRYR